MEGRRRAIWDAELGIDAIEPLHSTLPESGLEIQHAAVATYELSENGTRRGRLAILRACTPTTETNESSWSLECVSRVDSLPGLLDLRVVRQVSNEDATSEDTVAIVAAAADGTLRVFSADTAQDDKRHNWTVSSSATGNVALDANGQDDKRLLLSVDCRTESSNEAGYGFVCSDSTGGLHYGHGELKDSIGRSQAEKVHAVEVTGSITSAHDAEAWVASYGRAVGADDATVPDFLSGGDDGRFRGWDLRSVGGTSGCVPGRPVFSLKDAHGGVGVTSIYAYPRAGHGMVVLTGGYDDMVRVWDLRTTRTCVSEVNVGGGAWRIKQDPSASHRFLVACMYDGFKVVEQTASDNLNVACRYDEHESIAYGACWLPGLGQLEVSEGDECRRNRTGSRVALTGSFYDHVAHLWTADGMGET